MKYKIIKEGNDKFFFEYSDGKYIRDNSIGEHKGYFDTYDEAYEQLQKKIKKHKEIFKGVRAKVVYSVEVDMGNE